MERAKSSWGLLFIREDLSEHTHPYSFSFVCGCVRAGRVGLGVSQRCHDWITQYPSLCRQRACQPLLWLSALSCLTYLLELVLMSGLMQGQAQISAQLMSKWDYFVWKPSVTFRKAIHGKCLDAQAGREEVVTDAQLKPCVWKTWKRMNTQTFWRRDGRAGGGPTLCFMPHLAF